MNNGLTETEKKEKRALEKKLSEMEEELKVRLMNISHLHKYNITLFLETVLHYLHRTFTKEIAFAKN